MMEKASLMTVYFMTSVAEGLASGCEHKNQRVTRVNFHFFQEKLKPLWAN